MRKDILIVTSIGLLMVGCTPKINSIKSPINKLSQQCFNLPSKNYLSKSPINEQNLYLLTYNSLHKKGVPVTYGNTGNCRNYLYTSWVVSQGSETVTTGGGSVTSTYGNIYSNLNYSYPYSYAGTSQTYVAPTSTYNQTTYYGTYTLEVGILNKKSTRKSWEASQSSQLGASTLQEAESVTNSSQGIVDAMIETMLIENNFIKK